MSRLPIVAYGVVCYAVFLAAFLYSVGFVGDVVVPRTVDHAVAAPVPEALVVDIVLLGLFAVQHSVMARPGFKRMLTRAVPAAMERSTYVLASSLLLALLCWQWRTIPAVVWDVAWRPGRLAVEALFWAGWAVVLASTFMINHFDLFGLRQVYLAWRGRPYTEVAFRTELLYRLVRNPIMLGFLVAFWAAPTMTAGHLLFAMATTAYIFIALQFEEHDLEQALGEQYREYRRHVPMLVPGLRPGGRTRSPKSGVRPA
ncbi:MAG: methanethiol S-methyltransferase [Segniliparus sp.]|uniref:methanethiol S-methyltransferase n=1 Tax=Segniliparus sp. TaxID=2804064 RepID=UPI003F2E242E